MESSARLIVTNAEKDYLSQQVVNQNYNSTNISYGNYTENNAPCVCPAVYLLSDIQIKSSGTMSDPYVFAK